MPCKACEERVKDWKGSDQKCGFETGSFNEDNWNCATVGKIRRLIDSGDGVFVNPAYEDQRYAVIDLYKLPCAFPEPFPIPVSLYVGWYKNRERTECMWLMFETAPPRPPTEKECIKILEAYNQN